MSENILEQLKDWGLTPEQLIKVVADLKALSEGSANINTIFLGDGNHTVVIGNNFGGGKVKEPNRRPSRRQKAEEEEEIPLPDDEIHNDRPHQQAHPSQGGATDRDAQPSQSEGSEPSEETATEPKIQASSWPAFPSQNDKDAYQVLVANEDELVNFEQNLLPVEKLATKPACTAAILAANVAGESWGKSLSDNLDEILEEYFPELSA